MHPTNTIHPTARIAGNVQLGKHNQIGENVIIEGFRGATNASVSIGDCNRIESGTRILAGKEGISIGDWNVLHNQMLVMADVSIGHNCWFGQNTVLDGSGGLRIHNGVRVGMYSQIWTHVASGELIEGCTLFATRPTEIEDEVWLVGSCVVGSGLHLGRRAICLIGSNVTKDLEAEGVYAGVPAKRMEKLSFYTPVTVGEKSVMMLDWCGQFASTRPGVAVTREGSAIIVQRQNERLIIGPAARSSDSATTAFDLETKTYTKRLTDLEREFYRYIYDHKARFVPGGAPV